MQSDAASKRSAISARSLDLARIAIAHPGTRPAHTRHGPLEHHRSLPGPPVDARPDHTITLRVTASGAASRAVRDYCIFTGWRLTQHRNYDNTSARGSTERLCEADSVRKVKRCVADHCNTRNVMPDPIPRRPQRRASGDEARAGDAVGRNATWPSACRCGTHAPWHIIPSEPNFRRCTNTIRYITNLAFCVAPGLKPGGPPLT